MKLRKIFCKKSSSAKITVVDHNEDNKVVALDKINVEELMKDVVDDNEDELRETWTGKCDFFFSALGYAVGLGAVWRFPYLCYKNGGGVFLIPYFVFLLLVGIPLVFLEMCVGQFTSTGPFTCWTMVRLFRGVGISMNLVNGYLCIYYNMILAYSLYFLILSLTSKLPWETCGDQWKSPNCLDNYNTNFTFNPCTAVNDTLKCGNGRCYNLTTLSSYGVQCSSSNINSVPNEGWWKPIFPSQDYWNNVVLKKTENIDLTGSVLWPLVLCLLGAWLIVFLMVVRGIKVSGKLVYFTSLFPYVILLILGIRAWMLPGADTGIKFYIYPDFSRLADITVWTDAANQIFFTLSISYGGLVSLASYNNFNQNVMKDAIFVSLSNCLTSVFAGFVVFAYLGYLAFTTQQSIHNVVQAGQGLAFVVYPYAVTTIPVSPLWSILFFVMMLVLGLDTMMASVEITITSFMDLIPWLKKTRLRKIALVTFICSAYFLLGMPYCTQAGTYWVEILDNYSGSWAVLLVGALECISVTWFYGFNNFKRDISVMMGTKMTESRFFIIWRILWTVVSPIFLVVLVIFGMKDTSVLKNGNEPYPYWTGALGITITVSTISGVFLWAVYEVIDCLFINKKPLISLLQPTENWKPLKQKHQLIVKQALEASKKPKQKITNPNVIPDADGSENKSYEPDLTRF